MPRLFVIFRTYDRIWTCKTLTRELSPFEMDMSAGPIKFAFTVDQILPVSGSQQEIEIGTGNAKAVGYIDYNGLELTGSGAHSFYFQPHERIWPHIVHQNHQEKLSSCSTNLHPTSSTGGLVRRFSVPSLEVDPPKQSTLSIGDNSCKSTVYFVLPSFRCMLLMDAHAASCLQCEFSRSKRFRRSLMRFLRRGQGFRNCIPDYEKWTKEEREAWDLYLPVPYLIDVVAVWPKQKIDHAWSDYILCLLSKHVMLEEGFAWLSTLGGAHSSLGETFIHHAQRAGEISGHQLRLAMQLGNESLIARCHVFWAWSLLQRGHFKRCKASILRTWRFCKGLKGRDRVLENMCKAVWSRLRYRWALNRSMAKLRGSNGYCHADFEMHDDSSDSGDDHDKIDTLSGSRTTKLRNFDKSMKLERKDNGGRTMGSNQYVTSEDAVCCIQALGEQEQGSMSSLPKGHNRGGIDMRPTNVAVKVF